MIRGIKKDMGKYYGIGMKKVKDEITGEINEVHKIIYLTETEYFYALKQAKRIARKEKIKLEGIYPAKNNS